MIVVQMDEDSSDGCGGGGDSDGGGDGDAGGDGV